MSERVTVEGLADWINAKADAVKIPDPGTGGIVEDRIGTAAWMAPALQEAARYRAAARALREMSEALRRFGDMAAPHPGFADNDIVGVLIGELRKAGALAERGEGGRD